MFPVSLVIFALSLAASEAWVPPRTVTAHQAFRSDYHCATLLLGRKTEDQIPLKERVVGSHDNLFIANYCSGQQKKLVGEFAQVCDPAGAYPPSVTASGGRFSPLRVDCPQENEPCSELLHVNITLYCAPAPVANRL